MPLGAPVCDRHLWWGMFLGRDTVCSPVKTALADVVPLSLPPTVALFARAPLTHPPEEGYDNARNDINRDEQEIENFPSNEARRAEQGFDNIGRDADQGFNNAVQGIENAPQDIGSAFEGAAKWIGDKIGGVEGEGRRVEGDVDRFGDNMQNSYDQGQQQGEQQGGW